MCFQWDEITHVLMPVVLDRNLLEKNMLEAIQYMRQISAEASNIHGEEGIVLVEANESLKLTSDDVKRKMLKITEDVKSQNLNSRKVEQYRNEEYEKVFRPYINSLYKALSFESLHMQGKQFPMHVNMSGQAFKVTSILAFQEARRRGVLPADISFDPYLDRTYYDSIDMYLTNKAHISELCDEISAYDLDLENFS